MTLEMLSDERVSEIAQRAANGYIWRGALDPTAPHDYSVGTDMHQMKADIALLIQERRDLLTVLAKIHVLATDTFWAAGEPLQEIATLTDPEVAV